MFRIEAPSSYYDCQSGSGTIVDPKIYFQDILICTLGSSMYHISVLFEDNRQYTNNLIRSLPYNLYKKKNPELTKLINEAFLELLLKDSTLKRFCLDTRHDKDPYSSDQLVAMSIDNDEIKREFAIFQLRG